MASCAGSVPRTQHMIEAIDGCGGMRVKSPKQSDLQILAGSYKSNTQMPARTPVFSKTSCELVKHRQLGEYCCSNSAAPTPEIYQLRSTALHCALHAP
jgi:hypothetical protein